MKNLINNKLYNNKIIVVPIEQPVEIIHIDKDRIM